MMKAIQEEQSSIASAAEAAVRDLVRVSHWGQSSFINLPLIFPNGSSATVKLDAVKGGIRVSDNGFAYRALEAVGAQRSFGRTAHTVAAAEDLSVDQRTIFVDVTGDELVRAICDVATASWSVADKVFARIAEEDANELEDLLRARLELIFADRVAPPKDSHVSGASTTDWHVSAAVTLDNGVAVFQAVTSFANSINRATTSFLDLSGLDNPPHLVAVVRSKAEFGSKLSLLSQAGGRVIEEAQPDPDYLRAVA
jgi:hypothetical protein